MQSLNHFLWQRQKRILLISGVAFILLFFIVFSTSLRFYKQSQLDSILQISLLTVNNTLKVGDWDLIQKHIEASISQSPIFGVGVYTSGGQIVAGPIGDAKIGILNICSKAQTPGGVGINGCIKTFSAFDLGICIFLLILVALFYVGFFLFNKSQVGSLFIWIEQKLTKISSLENSKSIDDDLHSDIFEIQTILKKVKSLIYETERLSTEKASLDVAKQVSHDIRSPLSALTMMTSSLDTLPEEKRVLIRNSIQRINDIANQLLEKSKMQSEFNNVSYVKSGTQKNPVMLSSLVDALVSEKRTQFREKQGVQIEADISQSYGLFVEFDQSELQRVLSNLINNSIEALPNSIGKVSVSIRGYENEIALIVADNGRGIPEHILGKIGTENVTFGKEGTQSGSGLGLYHAKKIVESFGGKLVIQSKQGYGTLISIIMPKASCPKWFIKSINIDSTMRIVVLDDDLSIHGIWQGRFQSLQLNGQIISFTSGEDFRSWVMKNKEQLGATIFLIDYELLNQKMSGLDLIEELSIKAILVTSRFEEGLIRDRCAGLGICLIPKSMAGIVPIIIKKEKIRYDWVLLDDDDLIHLSWAYAAKETNIKFIGFKSKSDFEAFKCKIDPSSNIYIDSSLGEAIRGEEIAKKLFEEGFQNIYLATGYGADQFKPMDFIKAIVGKEPPGS